MAVEYRSVSYCDYARVLQDNDLCFKLFCNGWSGVDVTCNISSFDIVFANAPNVESDVVTRFGCVELFVVHFNGCYYTA